MQQDVPQIRLTRRQDVFGLVTFLLACLVVSGIGGLVTATSVGGWYTTLDKPAFNPPNWVFAPVWTLLYLAMAIAAWRVWRSPPTVVRRRALGVFGLQLALNLLWSVMFFGFQQIGLALVDIFLLFSAIAYCSVLFWRVERLAGWLFVPYLLWVGFAGALNLSLWLLN
jgi:tryptophan-rich sensory protein